ncbi:MAG: CopD family protein [Chloroflexota bacterium]
MRRNNRSLVILIALSVLLLVFAGQTSIAQAHVTLLRTDPPAEAVLSAAPSQIKLWFTDPIDPEFSRIDIVDLNGQRLSKLKIEVDATDPKMIKVAPGAMARNVYTVVWQVTSAVDGHLTSGNFVLYVGMSIGKVAPRAAAINTETPPATSSIALRWLNLLADAIVVGGLGFWLFVWTPTLTTQADSMDAGESAAPFRRIKRFLWIGWIYLGLLFLWSLMQQAILVTSTGIAQIITSRFGIVWLQRILLWGILGVAIRQAGQRRTQRPIWWFALAAGGGLLFLDTLDGHSASASILAPALAADWVHLLAMTLWVGGLITFALVLGTLRKIDPVRRVRLRAGLIGMFSNLSRIALVALLITGLYASYLHVGSTDALFTTSYGQLLLLKLVIIVPLLGVAAFNFAVTQRRLHRAANAESVPDSTAMSDRWSRILRGLVGVEIALTVTILLVVSIFSNVVPARSEIAAAQARQAALALEDVQYIDTQVTSYLHVTLDISPGYASLTNHFTIKLYDRIRGAPPNNVKRVVLRFVKRNGLDLSELELNPIGNGQYSATGDNLIEPAHWSVRTLVQRDSDDSANFDVNAIAAPPARTPDSSQIPAAEHKPILLGLGILSMLFGGITLAATRRDPAGRLLTLAITLLGVIFVVAGVLL